MEGMIKIGNFYFKNATTEVSATGPVSLVRRIALLVGAPHGAIRGESAWTYKPPEVKPEKQQ